MTAGVRSGAYGYKTNTRGVFDKRVYHCKVKKKLVGPIFYLCLIIQILNDLKLKTSKKPLNMLSMRVD